MVRRTAVSSRHLRLAAGAAFSLVLVTTCVGTSAAAAGRTPAPPGTLGPTTARAAGASVSVVSSVLDVVSSTGRKLRLRVLGLRSDTNTQVQVQIQTRNGVEEHDWTFNVPRSGVSVSPSGKGRLRLTSGRSAGRATITLRSTPHGKAVLSTCHRRTATRTRHVSLSGTLRMETRSKGKHAWGNIGSVHRKVHFSTTSKVRKTFPAASNCSPPQFPCRGTLLWQASGDLTDEFDIFTSVDKGAHAQIAGIRFVSLTEPAHATRVDLVALRQPSPNQLVVAGDGSATMQASFRGGTVTMSSADPPISEVERCGKGKKKITVEQWSGDLSNGSEPIVIPTQIFGDFSTADLTAAAFGRIRVKH